MISTLLASGVRVGRLCWVGQGSVILAAGGRPTNLDNGRTRANCVCSRCKSGLFGYFFSLAYHFSFASRITWDLTSFSTEFRLYRDDGRVMVDC